MNNLAERYEWAASLNLYGHGDTLFAMVAYFDESGKHAQAELLTIAGLVAPTREWEKLLRRWPSAMGNLQGPYHHSDCVSGTKGFRGVSEADREALQERLIACLSGIKYSGFGASLVRKHWDEFSAQLRPHPSMRDPWLFVFEAAINEMMEGMAKAGKTSSIALVFDRQDEFSSTAKTLYNKILTLTDLPWHNRLGALSFVSRDSVYPLQAADLFVYEVNRHARDARFKRSEAERWQMRRITEGCRGTICGEVYTRQLLKELVAMAKQADRGSTH